MRHEIWVPESRFRRSNRGRFLVEPAHGQTLMSRSGVPLWTEYSGEEVAQAVARYPDADIWTEHVEGDGSTFYSKGIARVNRSGSFVLVRRH